MAYEIEQEIDKFFMEKLNSISMKSNPYEIDNAKLYDNNEKPFDSSESHKAKLKLKTCRL